MRPMKKPQKRGEKEALSLIRRRRISTALRIGSVASIAVGIVGAVYVWQSSLLDQWIGEARHKMNAEFAEAGMVLEEIRIKGQKETALENIREALGVSHGVALMSLDLPAMKDNVENLNWVREATLMRVMPSALEVTITEHIPAALWQERERLWIITRDGIKITDQRLAHFARLPMVVGQGADRAMLSLLELSDLEKEFFSHIKSATWVGERRWDLRLRDGITIRLPERNMKAAWSKIVKMENLFKKEIMVVDLRVAGKMVVRLTPQAAEERRLADVSESVKEDI